MGSLLAPLSCERVLVLRGERVQPEEDDEDDHRVAHEAEASGDRHLSGK